MSLFALSDSNDKLPLDILISSHHFVSHSALTRDSRETPAAIVSQLTTVKARPLFVINIHADVVQGGQEVYICTDSPSLGSSEIVYTHTDRLYTMFNDFLYQREFQFSVFISSPV